jgi:outer membrane protein OmpA-like peptidoglycan-associated protein
MREGMKRLAVRLLAALILGAPGALHTAAAAAAPAAGAPRVPWAVRYELGRAEALLRRENARLHVGGEVQVLRDSEQVTLRVPALLLFSPDSDSLRPGLHAAELLSVPTALLRHRHRLMARIEVYTDNIGGVQLNQELSSHRAAALAGALRSAGISAHRVQAYGLGAAQALAANDSAQGRMQNRRVDFVFARLGSRAALAPPPDSASAGLRPAPAAVRAGG